MSNLNANGIEGETQGKVEQITTIENLSKEDLIAITALAFDTTYEEARQTVEKSLAREGIQMVSKDDK